MNSTPRHVRGWVFALLLALGACASPKISMEGSFPIPLVNQYPVTVGWVLDEELLAFTHSEKVDRGSEWVIKIGTVQQAMFDSLSKGMFKSHVFLKEEKAEPPVTVIFVPSIEELQFSTPAQTRSKYFEVWIKYKFKLLNADGSLRGEFPLTAYGKAHTQNYSLNTTTSALEEATNAACRDAMAFFALQFRTLPPVKTWLDEEGLGG